VPVGAGEGDQQVVGGAGELVAGWPALQQPQHGRGAQVVASDRQRGRVGRDEVVAEPVEQAALVSGGALVVVGDGAQLGGQLPMGDERAQAGVAVQGEQAGDAGVLGVVVLGGRAAAAGDQVGVDRQDHRAGVQQASTSRPWRVSSTTRTSAGSGSRVAIWAMSWSTAAGGVLHPAELDHPFGGPSQGDEVEGLGPVDPNPKHHASSPGSPTGGGAAPC
jgi:hypothetical protein